MGILIFLSLGKMRHIMKSSFRLETGSFWSIGGRGYLVNIEFKRIIATFWGVGVAMKGGAV